MWRPIYDALDDCPLQRELFPGGQPLQSLRDALQEAASRLDMRRVDFDDPTRPRWYWLLLLQGGIPLRDVELLPAWLSNPAGRSLVVGKLQETAPAFRAAWTALEQLRHGRSSRDHVKRELARCPFLRGPHEEILDATLAQVAAGQVLEEPVAVTATVRLEWPAGKPAPHAVITPVLTAFAELGPRVALSINGVRRATFLRRGDALTRLGRADLELVPALRWTVDARGEADSLCGEVSLFEDDEQAIACLDESGARCSPQARSVRWVVARQPVAGPPGHRVFNAEGISVAEVQAGSAVCTLEGGVLWPITPPPPQIDEIARTIRRGEVTPGAKVGGFTVLVHHDPAIQIRAARVGSASCAVTVESAGRTRVEGVVPAMNATAETRLTLSAIASGRDFQRTLRFRAFTAASLDGAWLDRTSVVDAERLQGGALCVSLGPEYEGRDARLVTGVTSSTIDPGRRALLRVRALGYGEPLVLCGQEPWREGPRAQLAARVETRGIVVRHDVREGRVRAVLREALEAGEGYWLLVWPQSAAPEALALDRAGDFEATYSGDGRPRAVAVCFGEAVTGVSWADDWSTDLGQAGVDSATLVKLIRALHLPVLAAEHLAPVAHALQSLGLPEATDALLGQRVEVRVPRSAGGEAALVSSSDNDLWGRVARAILLRLRLSDPDQLSALTRMIDERFRLSSVSR